MPTMRITCPESAHLEEIDFELHPLGMLIKSCSSSRCGDCPRTCAARLDRRGKFMFVRSCLR